MKKAGCLSYTKAELDRRDFLRVGSLSLLGIHLSQYLALKHVLAAAESEELDRNAKAQACILLWLEGGPSHIDTWDPKSNSSFKPISTNVPGIQISELLPRVSRQMDKLSVIRSMQTEEIDHPKGIHYAVTGHRPNRVMRFPSLGSIIAKEMGPRGSFPPYLLLPTWEEQLNAEYFKAGDLGGEYNPMFIPDPSRKDFRVADLSLPKSLSVERIEERRSFLRIVDRLCRQKEEMAEFSSLNKFTEQALNILLSPAVRKAFDLSQESGETKKAYGLDGFGQSVLMARRLVEAGCRFVTARGNTLNPWDTHKDNDVSHRDVLVPALDQTLSALLEDLDQRGLLESTVVLAMGEFGRTPHVNPDAGRDHWPHCWSLVLGGGGIRGGQVIGASDERGAYLAAPRVTIGDIFATIYKAFGIDWKKEYMTSVGRPIKIANSIDDKTGQPLTGLV